MKVMSPISINNQEEIDGGWEFSVETPSGTTHTVTLNEGYYRELTGGDVSPERLIFASFTFLLSNESADAILESFALSDIETYFPDFPSAVTERHQNE